jgi:nitrite reductase (NADH) large subunit
MRIVIIGYGPAAVRALAAIDSYEHVLSRDNLQVNIVSAEDTVPYSPMFLIEYLAGKLDEGELYLQPENRAYGLPVEKILGTRVAQVKEREKVLILKDGREMGYDKLLIATGALAIKPAIQGISKKGVFVLNRLDDAKKLSKEIEDANDVLILGGGPIGIEAAMAFNNLGKKVKVIELLDQILPQVLDRDLSSYVERKLVESGIRFLLGEAAAEITGEERARGIVVGRKELRGDLILITAGVEPNIDFLKSTQLRLDRGVIVNEMMETNISNIYAAGDVAQSENPYGKYEAVFSWHSAVEEGWIAGCNLVGLEKRYQYCPNLTVLKGSDFPIVSIGGKDSENEYQILSYKDERRGILEKVFIRNNHLDCYQAVGITHKVGLMYHFIKDRKDISEFRDTLLSQGVNLVGFTI